MLYSKTCQEINGTYIPETPLGWQGNEETLLKCLTIPSKPYQNPIPQRETFPKKWTSQVCKMKDLIPQKKVKEWVQSSASHLTSDEDLSEADAESTEHILQQLDRIHASDAILIRGDKVTKSQPYQQPRDPIWTNSALGQNLTVCRTAECAAYLTVCCC